MKREIYKYIVLFFLAACMALSLAACKRYKQIPEETLADIFRDMYELNAYMDRNSANLNLDSVDIYGPLIAKYGYTTRDFTNTLTDAAKRKSFRITDIVEASIAKLEAEREAVVKEVRIQEIIDSTAYAVSRHEIYRDSLIAIRSIADSARMKVRVPVEDGGGKIDITYYYELDSLDRNKELTDRHALLNDKGVTRSSSTLKLLPKKRTKYNTVLSAMDDVTQLEIAFGNYPAEPKRMHLTIDSLVVVQQPSLKKAYEILSHQYTYRLLIDGKEYHEYYPTKENSGALHLLSPLVDPQRDSVVVGRRDGDGRNGM